MINFRVTTKAISNRVLRKPLFKNQGFPLVSVIILNYNGSAFLEECLASVLNTNYSALEVLFVDNCSTDGSAEMAERLFGKNTKLQIIKNQSNLGFAGGNNVGAKKAKGKFLAFLNNDIMVESNWLDELVEFLMRNRTVGAVQPKVLSLQNPENVSNAGADVDWLGFTYDRGRHEPDKGQHDQIEDVSLIGCALVVRRDLFDKVGGFDESFTFYLEDTDLCWRIWLAGHRTTIIPKSVVYHLNGASLNKRTLSWRLPFWVGNQFSMLYKNYSLVNLLWSGFIITIFYSAFAIFLTSKRNSLLALGVMKGFVRFLANLRKTLRQRLLVQKNLRVVNDEYIRSRFLRKPDFLRQFRTRYQRMMKQA